MKYLIAGALALGLSSASVAQSKIAIEAGYNHNSARIFAYGEKQSSGYVPGYHIAARIKTAFEPPLHFVGMLAYSKRGFTYNPSFGDTSKLEAGIHYIDIAPMLSFDIPTSGNSHFSITAGPILGFAFSGRQKITENNVTRSEKMKFSFSGDYGYANLALHTGLSYHFNKMFIEGAYHLGLNSINNNEEFDETNIKHRGFALSLGYWIR